MAEPHHLGSPAPTEAASRDGRVDTLLLDGLDHYFNARYDEAIHVWTRVLFLDRHHASARAYIERARTALAERQRRADALVEAASDLLADGRATDARGLLEAAAAEGADDDRAAAVRRRIERLEQLQRATTISRTPAPAAVPTPAWHWPRRRPALHTAVIATAVTCLSIAGALVAREWMSAAPASVSSRDTPVSSWPRLTSSDVALQRARNAFAAGRLADALVALDRVNADSPNRAEADQLRLRLQQMLIPRSPAPSPPEVRHP